MLSDRDNFIFFWGGPFSQWYKCKFTIDDIEYNCAEQFMMASKAKLFKDEEAYKKIIESSNPRKQKAIGREVIGFNEKIWLAACREIVYQANLAKFSDPELKKFLLETGDKEIVEASPEDKLWGVGLHEDDPRILDKAQWLGKNWLGEALMRVRETLRDVK